MAVTADTRTLNIDLVKAVGAADWDGAIVKARLLNTAVSGTEVMPPYSDTVTTASDGTNTMTLVTPADDGTAYTYQFQVQDSSTAVLMEFESEISYGATALEFSAVVAAAGQSNSTNANTLTALIDSHEAASDPHAGYMLSSGDSATGTYILTSTSSNSGGTYPWEIRVTPDSNTFPSPAMVLRNVNDGTGANRYDGEVHLWFRAGATRNERRYINWRTYDNSSDDWIMGVNASDDFILYDGLVHRFWFPNSGANNYTAISATGTGRVRLNYHQSDTTGSGGVSFHSGAANGNAYFTAALITPRDLTGEARIYLDVDSAFYHAWRNSSGTQYWLTGKGTVNQYRIYNDVLDRDALSIASATNVITLGGNVSHSGYEVYNYGENVVSASISSGSITFNAQTANVFTVSLTENITSAPSITWPANSDYCSIEVIYTQDATGGRTVTHTGMVGSDSGTAPDISTTANAVSRVVYSTPDGGTTEYADLIGKDYASI